MVAASFSSSEYDISLGASPLKKRHLRHLRRQPMLPIPELVHSAEAA